MKFRWDIPRASPLSDKRHTRVTHVFILSNSTAFEEAIELSKNEWEDDEITEDFAVHYELSLHFLAGFSLRNETDPPIFFINAAEEKR